MTRLLVNAKAVSTPRRDRVAVDMTLCSRRAWITAPRLPTYPPPKRLRRRLRAPYPYPPDRCHGVIFGEATPCGRVTFTAEATGSDTLIVSQQRCETRWLRVAGGRGRAAGTMGVGTWRTRAVLRATPASLPERCATVRLWRTRRVQRRCCRRASHLTQSGWQGGTRAPS